MYDVVAIDTGTLLISTMLTGDNGNSKSLEILIWDLKTIIFYKGDIGNSQILKM